MGSANSLTAALPLYWNNLYDITTADEMSQNEAFRFFDWFVFDYQHADEPPLIQVYREENYDDLATVQQAVLDNWRDAPPAAAYELDDYEGQNLKLRDFVTGDRYELYEAGGHGDVQPGNLILARLVPVAGRLEFSVVAAYLPEEEIGDLGQQLETARAADAEKHPHATYTDFMRRHNVILIHHALSQAEVEGGPPVARQDPKRQDNGVRNAVQRLKKLGPKGSEAPVPKGQSLAIHDKTQTPKPKV
jgi:hypothetical protein